ncbi:MAG TPA: hypothetical protein VH309_06815 [Elusimicrobiota bacterium]|nr:hypothetical protein [Elusimicrobiota bacterium]
MNRNWMVFVFAAAVLCAVGAHAQGDQAPSADQAPAAAPADAGTAAPAAAPSAAEKKKEARKMAWEDGVKKDCSAELADGGVCAGKDFDSGLEKCLHTNRAKLSDGCKAAVHPHHKGAKHKKHAAMKAPEAAPAEAPAAAPAETPAPAPQQ